MLGKGPICVRLFCGLGRLMSPIFANVSVGFFGSALPGEETCFLHRVESLKNFFWGVYICNMYMETFCGKRDGREYVFPAKKRHHGTGLFRTEPWG